MSAETIGLALRKTWLGFVKLRSDVQYKKQPLPQTGSEIKMAVFVRKRRLIENMTKNKHIILSFL